MDTYAYRLLNVFALPGQPFTGNPLCVFENGAGLDDAAMQALAKQFNLSETTFILPSDRASARVRFFTPAFELPFAGHPTLGTAHVVRALRDTGDAVTLEMKTGVIDVSARGDAWTLRTALNTSFPVATSRHTLADMLGLNAVDIGEQPLWIDAGNEQLVIPLTSTAAVERCAPAGPLLLQHAPRRPGPYLCLVWAPTQGKDIVARFFFPNGTAVVEDPATGSACAALGGWFVATGASLPLTRDIRQGDLVGRPSLLGLRVDAQRQVFVTGEVQELGRGVVQL